MTNWVLAKTSFNDPMLRDNGGSLGYFTVDEIDPAFEEAAFAPKIGELSQPVRTNDGYSIIRVDDRKRRFVYRLPFWQNVCSP